MIGCGRRIKLLKPVGARLAAIDIQPEAVEDVIVTHLVAAAGSAWASAWGALGSGEVVAIEPPRAKGSALDIRAERVAG